MRYLVAALALGLASYLVGLVAQLPAARAQRWLGLEGVELVAPRGSVWEGRARELRVGELGLPAPRWSLHVPPLLLGRAVVDLRSQWGGGRLRLGPGEDLHIRGLAARVPVQEALAGTPAAAFGPRGELVVDLAQAGVAAGRVTALDGRLRWESAALTRPALALGGFELTLDAAEATVRGRLRDTGGPLEVAGDLSLTPDGRYLLDLTLAARPGADPALVDALRLLGRPDPAGRLRLQHRGTLAQLGLGR